MTTPRHLGRAAALSSVALATGCTLLFPSNFSDRAVVTRGPIYEGMAIVAIAEAAPPHVFEPDTQPDIALGWRGNSAWPSADVVDTEVGDQRVAFMVELPYDLPIGAGQSARLDVIIDGERYGSIEVEGLPEATLGGTMNVDELEPLYTRVVIDEDLIFEVLDDSTSRPVRIRTTHSLELGAVEVDASGTPGDGGPGACMDDCPGTPGGPGDAGHDDPADGEDYGDPALLDLEIAGGSPGGGTAGGGGGGVLELTTLGSCSSAPEFPQTVLRADGGDGDTGGGSGGSVLLRCRDDSSGRWVASVVGGSDAASNGYVRFDVPSGAPGDRYTAEQKNGGGSSSVVRGPMFTQPSMRLIPAGADDFQFPLEAGDPGTGGDSDTVVVVDVDGEQTSASPVHRTLDTFDVTVPVTPGRIHRVCLLPRGTREVSDTLLHEKQNCTDFAAP